MIWVDYCILAVTLISVVVGVLRGFTKEIFSLLNWALAFGLAWLFGDAVSDQLRGSISIPALRVVAGHAVCFFGGLLLGAVLAMLLVESVRNSRLAAVDRTLGAGFGLLRALLLAAVFVMIADNMGARQERWRQNSVVVSRLEWLAGGVQVLVPETWLEAIRPQPDPPTAPPAELPAEPGAPEEGSPAGPQES